MNKQPMHKPKEHKNAKKILDIVPPGKAMASPTSRPVITGHKPPVADDQFVPKQADGKTMAGDPSEKRDLMDPKHKVQVAPITETPSMADAAPEVTTVPAATELMPAPALHAAQVQADPATSPQPQTASSAPSLSDPATTPVQNTAAPAAQTVAAPVDTTVPLTEAHAATPEHLAVEQVVAEPKPEDARTPVQATPTAAPTKVAAPASTVWQLPEEEKHAPVQGHHSAKTIDELLAETGAPNLEPEHEPPKQLIVSHHTSGGTGLKWLLAIVIILILVVVVVDVLLDAGTFTTNLNIPHTNFIN